MNIERLLYWMRKVEGTVISGCSVEVCTAENSSRFIFKVRAQRPRNPGYFAASYEIDMAACNVEFQLEAIANIAIDEINHSISKEYKGK